MRKYSSSHLNEDHAGESGAIIQHLSNHGAVSAAVGSVFLAEVADEQLHAQFLANKIAALGGEPATIPRVVPPARANREMLEAALKAERQATEDYTQRAREAERIFRDWPL